MGQLRIDIVVAGVIAVCAGSAATALEAVKSVSRVADNTPVTPNSSDKLDALTNIKDRTSPPDRVSELEKSKVSNLKTDAIATGMAIHSRSSRRTTMVDWGTWNGFRRYHDACHVCHGPNALGSSFAPALADSLKTVDYDTFLATVSSGKKENKGGTEFVMPSFGEDKNIMCYIDDIYTYIKARSLNIMPPGRPAGREDISPEAKKAADDCTG